jgi:hypothetical protein
VSPAIALAAGTAAALVAGTAATLVALHASRRRSQRLSEEVGRLASRLEEMEQATAHLAVQVEVAESVLLDKGIADEQDLEAARRSLEAPEHPGYLAERDGNLH